MPAQSVDQGGLSDNGAAIVPVAAGGVPEAQFMSTHGLPNTSGGNISFGPHSRHFCTFAYDAEEPFWTGSRTPGCRAGRAIDVELIVHSGLFGKYLSRARDTVLLVGRRRSDRMLE